MNFSVPGRGLFVSVLSVAALVTAAQSAGVAYATTLTVNSFADLAEKLERLLGIPATPTISPPSMDPPRSRRRRTSGHHEV